LTTGPDNEYSRRIPAGAIGDAAMSCLKHKLAKELSRRATGRTLYLLDEPTTGLHFEDIRKLLDVLDRLVEQGNSVVVIEHNLDVIRAADWVIDLGPEGGDGGGRVVAEGPPERIAKVHESRTGLFLKNLRRRRAAASR